MTFEYDIWHRRRESIETGHNSRGFAIWYQVVAERLPDLHGLRVAEVDCGRGEFTILLEEKGALVVSLDASTSAGNRGSLSPGSTRRIW